VSTIPTLDTAAFEAGLAKNYFHDEGLKIETTPTVGGSAGIPAESRDSFRRHQATS
jgi:hypothetical protein